MPRQAGGRIPSGPSRSPLPRVFPWAGDETGGMVFSSPCPRHSWDSASDQSRPVFCSSRRSHRGVSTASSWPRWTRGSWTLFGPPGNEVAINIAGKDGIRTRRLSSLELRNPRVAADREAVVSAIAASDELGTAIPSVDFYSAGGDASIAAMLARGARSGRPQIVYTAENNNFAAEILREKIRDCAPGEEFRRPAVPEHRGRQDERRGVLRGGDEAARSRAAGPRVREMRAGGGVQPDPHLADHPARLRTEDPRLRGKGRPASVRGGKALRAQRRACPAGLPCPAPRLRRR